MRVFDTTTFFEEKLMMDLRFNILNPYVDKFVVCEARVFIVEKKKILILIKMITQNLRTKLFT